MKNIVSVRIFNRPYNLSTDDSELYIKKISSIVDEKIKANVSASPGSNVIDAAILTALEAVDEKQKALSTIDNLRAQIKDYVDDAGEARLKCDEAQKQLRAMKAKYEELEKEVEIRRMFNKKAETEAAVKQAEEQTSKPAGETLKPRAAGVRKTSEPAPSPASQQKPPITSASTYTSTADNKRDPFKR